MDLYMMRVSAGQRKRGIFTHKVLRCPPRRILNTTAIDCRGRALDMWSARARVRGSRDTRFSDNSAP